MKNCTYENCGKYVEKNFLKCYYVCSKTFLHKIKKEHLIIACWVLPYKMFTT